MDKLTKRQKEILDFITYYLKDNEYSPSYMEIADHFGILASYRDAFSIDLPLVGLITAGEPIEAIEDRETMAVPSDFVPNIENSYILKVKGQSMIDEGIWDGDYVIIERNHSPKNGDVVVALLDNAYATLKKFYREKNRIRLQPANSSMKPVYSKDPLIQGIVRAVIRKFAVT
ncbi:MAG: LexA repressor [Parcubacteria group bacterium GW2011_GWA2_43_17]|nr:MAG: LexA repressor [Parcubacteria group bacterium GW2011_GWA2_43_17]